MRALREDAGLSQDELAASLMVTRSMISKYEDGRHDMGPEILVRAAKRFDVTPSYILFGDAVVYAERTAPIQGRVGAGAKIEAIQEANPETVVIPGELDDAQAFRVEGDSCLPIFEPGDVLVVRGGPRAIEGEFLNRYCVVQTSDGLGYVKRVTPGVSVPGRGRLYNLESENAETIENQQIESARPVLLRFIQGGR